MSKILLIDNYDSFTYNLFHYLEELSNYEVIVVRNDELILSKLEEFDRVVISPGPGLPSTAGELSKFLERFYSTKKILGICLGQQAIAECFGMGLKNLNEVVHGQATPIKITKENEKLFEGLPKKFKVGRYHSWVIDPETVNPEFEVTSIDENGNIMSISHNTLSVKAVQFHPESVLTEYGKEMIKNWLES